MLSFRWFTMIDYAAFVDELEKIALARWQKELAAGNISLGDIGAPTVEAARKSFAAMPELAGKALSRQRALSLLKTPAQAAALNKLKNISVNLHPSDVGAASSGVSPKGGLQIQVGPGAVKAQTNTEFETLKDQGRYALGGVVSMLPKSLASKVNKSLGMHIPIDDATTHHAVFRHELGEAKDMLRGRMPAPYASHAGITPLLEERMAIHGDPRAASTFAGLRKDPENARAAALLKQVGGVGGHLVQPGTRQARSLERLIKMPAKASVAPTTPQSNLASYAKTLQDVGRRHANKALADMKALGGLPTYLGPGNG
jgi:hypothetical protein